MGVYRLLWSTAIEMSHFELTWDPEDSKGVRRSLCHFCFKPLQYGCLWTPLATSNQDLTFWADSGPLGHWGHRGFAEVTWSFLFQTPTIWVSTDSPGSQQTRFRWFGPWGQILGPRALWPQIQKSAICTQNPTIWVSIDLPGPLNHFWGNLDPGAKFWVQMVAWHHGSILHHGSIASW